MAIVPIILIEGNEGQYGWKGNSSCPRQPSHESTKNMWCPVRESCTLPEIYVAAPTQKEARGIMASAELPICNDNRRFCFLDQIPSGATLPDSVDADFVVTPILPKN